LATFHRKPPLGHPAQPRLLRGFEKINRYWDNQHECWAAKILPGEYYVTTGDEIITTVLGSCVSACIRDRVFGIGGMNHFMLPSETRSPGDATSWGTEATRYGSFAMEHLINDILKNGGRRENLEIKIVGGGQIIANMTDVGRRNIDFVRRYLKTEGFMIAGEEVGDIYPRKVLYLPQSGAVRVKKLRTLHNTTVISREERYIHELEVKPVAGSVELF
jgi:chemotaxis protein CheD